MFKLKRVEYYEMLNLLTKLLDKYDFKIIKYNSNNINIKI